jgi:hypothetical protein
MVPLYLVHCKHRCWCKYEWWVWYLDVGFKIIHLIMLVQYLCQARRLTTSDGKPTIPGPPWSTKLTKIRSLGPLQPTISTTHTIMIKRNTVINSSAKLLATIIRMAKTRLVIGVYVDNQFFFMFCNRPILIRIKF